MRLWPFVKDSDKSKSTDAGSNLSQVAENELALTPTVGDEALDIDLYAHRSFNNAAIRPTAFLDAIIPAAGAAVDAVAQYNHAIVRFPKGAKWADLIDRKTPG